MGSQCFRHPMHVPLLVKMNSPNSQQCLDYTKFVMVQHKQGDHKIPTTKLKDNSRIFQGSFHDFQGCWNSTETVTLDFQVCLKCGKVLMKCAFYTDMGRHTRTDNVQFFVWPVTLLPDNDNFPRVLCTADFGFQTTKLSHNYIHRRADRLPYIMC